MQATQWYCTFANIQNGAFTERNRQLLPQTAQSASALVAHCSHDTSQFESTRIYILRSSANTLTETPNSSKVLIRSFMNITNIMGPIPLPWMTREKIAGSDNEEFILVWWVRSQKKLVSHDRSLSRMQTRSSSSSSSSSECVQQQIAITHFWSVFLHDSLS